jgi:hypothetical protein
VGLAFLLPSVFTPCAVARSSWLVVFVTCSFWFDLDVSELPQKAYLNHKFGHVAGILRVRYNRIIIRLVPNISSPGLIKEGLPQISVQRTLRQDVSRCLRPLSTVTLI